MRKLLSNLASLKLTVVLLVLVGLVLSAGTILESLRGAEAAKAVYEAGWFYALQGLLALNIVAALVDRWPKNRWRIGFALTHLSILLILFGAVLTVAFKQEGQLVIEEGQQNGVVARPGGGADIRLPFAVHLDAFEIDVYPGTQRPAMFRSRVRVVDGSSAPQPHVIEMNRPLSYGGWKFFQSSYHIDEQHRATVLSVSRDPGQAVVFAGYGLLVLGMIVVFATRLVQFRQAEALRAASPLPVSSLPGRSLPVLALLVATGLAAPSLDAAKVPDAATVDKLRALPVQHDGRTMPFDTQAREAVLKVTGRSGWGGLDPVAMVAGFTFDAHGWQHEPIVAVGGADNARAAGLPPGTAFASFEQLLSSPSLRDAVLALRARERDEKMSGPDKDLSKLEARLSLLNEHFTGGGIRYLPVGDPKGAWRAASGATSAAEIGAFPARLRAIGGPAHYPSEAAMAREILYNRMRPTRLAWLLLLPAAVLASLTAGGGRARLRPLVAFFLVGGFAAMTWGLATRWQVAGRIPASDMYESMLFLGWGVGLFGVVALALRQRLLIANAAGLGAVAMALADLLPIDPFIHPMAPVLSGTPWLAIHVPIIVVSYSVLAMATGLAHLVVGVEVFAPERRDLSARWSELLYWYLHVGSILLIAGILTGSIWAASSWGRYWGWDPKEVWSLIAFLAYMAILHARFDEEIRSFGVAVASIAAFWTILMTYLGVNFVLASGLHSYGFGSSNLVRIFGAIALVECAFLGAAWRSRRAPRIA
jgi:cytochrome c-type biogenesis protein CcsB